MIKKKAYIIGNISVLLLALILTACQTEVDLPQHGEGTLKVRLSNVLSQVGTRSTPAEIGAPSLDRFSLVVRNQSGTVCYQDKLKDTAIPLATGLYNVSVSCGDNPLIAIDEPYYLGTTDNVSVEQGQETPVDVTCSVANSLVSVRFGRDEQEQARFSRIYDSYAVCVHLDKYYATIPGNKTYQSVYFRSGNSVSLEFTGVLKEDGRRVSTMLDLSQTDFPSSFAPAVHAIVTLSLPDPQNLLAIDISAVEVEEVTLQQTIPLSWLPVPGVQVRHVSDSEGRLAGTDIDFGNGYPGYEWKAVVENSANTIVRTAQGEGTLASGHEGQNTAYLPSGQYRAVFYVIKDGKESEVSARDFTVTKPTVDIELEGYTSYSKYQSGDVDGANSCDAYTLYDPSANIKIAPSLLNASTYASSVTTKVNDDVLSGTTDGSLFTYPNMTNMTPSLTEYTLSCTATFADITVTKQKKVRITGLPVEYAPPSTGAGWSSKGKVEWNDSDNGTPRIRLGQNTTSQPQYITSGKFAIPSGTKIDCPYKVAVHRATVSTTLTLSVGNYEYFSGTSSYNKTTNFDNHAVFTLNGDATSVKANNSYGSGQTKSYIYKLSYKYAK